MKTVLLTDPVHPAGMAILEARDDLRIVQADGLDREKFMDAVRDVHGIFVRMAVLDEELLAAAENLEVVSRHGVGCDSIAVEHLTGRGIPVAIATDANALSVTEHTMMLFLATTRKLLEQDGATRKGDFAVRMRAIAGDLCGQNALIIGFGRIGKRVAAMCRAFGMEVTVADIELDRQRADELGCRAVEDFRPELKHADIVSLHVPLDASTFHILGETEYAAMKPGAIVINCARGAVLDEEALAAALQRGHLGAAGLDVFETEPPPADHPLFGRPDVIVTPHTGGTSENALVRAAELTAQNILDCFDGRLKPENVFNPEVLERVAPNSIHSDGAIL